MSLKRTSVWIWAALGLVVAVFAAWWVRAPGYMDADYYFANAHRIVDGGGLQEPFIWNYLDDPAALPHPAFAYWMPLTSFVSALAMAVAGSSFRAAQAPFVLATVAIPLLTAGIASQLSSDKSAIRQAAALAVVPGFFLPFLVSTDSFSIYLLIGAAAMLLMARSARSDRRLGWLGAGALVGLAHLTRADGILLLLVGLVAAWPSERRMASISLLFVGYLGVMLPWWARNMYAVGSPFSPGLNRTLWLLRYDDLFSYPASILTPQRWWASGLGAILTARLDSLLTNLESLVAVNGLIFLGPFMFVGALEKRSDLLVRLNVLYLLLLLGVMSFVFPFAGARGGFFHSSTAIMPLLWCLAPIGVRRAVDWASARRGWVVARARVLFGWSAPGLAAVLTLGLFWTRVVGASPASPAWSQSASTYAQVGQILSNLDSDGSPVAANNPPGMYLASGAPSVMIPDGTPETLRAVTQRYGVRWVVLDANRPEGLATLYLDPESLPWLVLERKVGDAGGGEILILRVTETPP
jgi:4-amino-4-deoxy-L-arabinose transferase-like glycosyltransferase